MKSSGVKLSLKNWPTSPIKSSSYKISPLSSKVIKKAGLAVKSILPESEANFFSHYDVSHKSQE